MKRFSRVFSALFFSVGHGVRNEGALANDAVLTSEEAAKAEVSVEAQVEADLKLQNRIIDLSFFSPAKAALMAAERRLRVCNGYEGEGGLIVKHNTEVLNRRPIAYKACREFEDLILENGESLVFSLDPCKSDKCEIGVFIVQNMPADPQALLLLTASRPSADSELAGFEAYTMNPTNMPQLAVLDAQRRPSGSRIEFKKLATAAPEGASEPWVKVDTSFIPLDIGAVRTISRGLYTVRSMDPSTDVGSNSATPLATKSFMVNEEHGDYSLMRVGADGDEDLVVFPYAPVVVHNKTSSADSEEWDFWDTWSSKQPPQFEWHVHEEKESKAGSGHSVLSWTGLLIALLLSGAIVAILAVSYGYGMVMRNGAEATQTGF